MIRRLLRRIALGWAIALATVSFALAAHAAEGPGAGRAEHRILVLLDIPPAHFQPGAQYGDAYDGGPGRLARRRTALRLARAHGLALVDDWPMPLLGLDCFVMQVPEGRSVESEAQRMSHEGGVAWAQPVNTYRGQGGPAARGGPLFLAQPDAREWRLSDLHQAATGRNVTVAVVDSAVEAAHPDLKGRVRLSRNFVPAHPERPEQHGTGVAGIIAARGVRVIGVAPDANLMALRACWQADGPASRATTCDSLSLAEAVHFAIEHGAQVINLSLAGPPDRLLARLIDIALARRVTVVGAVDASLPGGGFPASHPGVVAVADESLGAPRAGVYSAPGRDIPTTEPGGRWFLVNGSSYAAAHVSGLFALLRERSRRSDGSSALVTRTSRSIDACASLARATGSCECACLAGRASADLRR